MKTSLGAVTLAFPLPAFLVGSYDANGRANIMTAAWGGIASSDPPCLSVSIRPSRWSYAAILANRAFTVSIPDSRLAAAADYAGLVSGRDHDKFAQAGLTAVRAEKVNAPYVGESPVAIECELYKTLDLGAHTLFVGRIVDVKAEEGLIKSGGGLDMAGVDPIVFNSGGDYHRVGESVGQAFAIGKSFKSPK
ncbi:MAG: flavin reductase family protein [Candidatus Adiutrix sp.]|jgi:flavin reductase (DIM6/NTAB) family NADH-FMN oxidoreductase RutF|nr:flavin reductase family protein [Candidatus Adiutrix sp.]